MNLIVTLPASMHRISLGTYDVTVGRGVLRALGDVVRAAAPAHRYALITDSTVQRLHGDEAVAALGGASTIIAELPPGEQHKTRETWARITDQLLAAGCGRDTTIIALGGGVVGDLAGFVAATFMRGIPYVQVPTTLLAMIDAAIGGKTGVDTRAGKNLVGAFHQPAAVLADTDVLATLAPSQLRAGLAEAIKHGVIADAAYFERVVQDMSGILAEGGTGSEAMTALVVRSVEIKADVVMRDERERGLRKILNFGHTLGHAIEALSGYTLLHGEAVAIGMALESRLAERCALAAAGTADRVVDVVVRAGLPIARPREIDVSSILEATKGDKKVRGGAVEYALPRRIGEMAGAESGWAVRVDDDVVREVLS
jgi:3-dehydroquinate synthase